MYIKIKKVKTGFSILLRYIAASLGDWGPKILEKHGGLICWGRKWKFSVLKMGAACCPKKYGTITSDVVPNSRNMETSIDML